MNFQSVVCIDTEVQEEHLLLEFAASPGLISHFQALGYPSHPLPTNPNTLPELLLCYLGLL